MHMRTIAAWLLMAGAAVAGEATVTDSFHIDAPQELVVEWLDAHQSECRAAMSIRLESQADDVLTLSRENRRGRWVWKQRDTVSRHPGRWHLESTLVEALEGGIIAFASDVVVAADGRRTLVSATSTVDVEGVTTKELKVDLHGRARRLRELLHRELAR